jgi:hypothetical protein
MSKAHKEKGTKEQDNNRLHTSESRKWSNMSTRCSYVEISGTKGAASRTIPMTRTLLLVVKSEGDTAMGWWKPNDETAGIVVAAVAVLGTERTVEAMHTVCWLGVLEGAAETDESDTDDTDDDEDDDDDDDIRLVGAGAATFLRLATL